MLLARWRFIFMFFVFGFAIYMTIKLDYLAIPLYIATFLLGITHFMFSTVSLAFRKLKAGKIQEAESLLNMVKRPQWLHKGQKAYYHLSKGLIAMQHDHLDVGEQELAEAYDTGLRNENDKAITLLNLAHIHFIKKNYAKALKFLQESKKHAASDLQIKKKQEEMEQVLQKKMN